jgi:transcriptional regulator with XRE-family HTH domain
MAKKVGTLIKQARTDAGLTQEQLARKVRGCSASDISRAERGEKELTQEQLKQIAKATGVTQKSLLEAARGTSAKKTGTGATAGKTSMKVSAAEKKLVELYRAADSDTKKAAVKLLKGSGGGTVLETLLGGAIDLIGGKRSVPEGEDGEA